MKTIISNRLTRLLWLTALCLCSALGIDAQNTISVPEIHMHAGGKASLPVNMNNTTDVVAVQMTIAMPKGFSLSTGTASLADRADDHTIEVSQLADNRYLVLIMSASNKPFRGSTGKLFDIDLYADSNVEEGSSHSISIENAVMSKANGENVLTSVDTKKIIVDRTAVLSLVVDREEAHEGDVVKLKISTNVIPDEPLSVSLHCTDMKRVELPNSIEIPAGKSSIEVEVKVLDDEVPNLEEVVTFTATAMKYESGETDLVLVEEDIPVLRMELAPTAVSESAGKTALMGKIVRESAIDSEAVVIIEHSDTNELEFSSQRIVFTKGETEKQFTVGVIDNNMMDGNRTVEITASVFISSCNCSVSSGKLSGFASAEIEILDDDSPTVGISCLQDVLLEGKANAGNLVISRNTETTKELKVTISCDIDNDLIYEHSVVIPAGQSSVTIPIGTKTNSVTDDDRIVTFTVIADGYNKGTCWVTVTDQSMPDAIIKELVVSDTDVLPGDKVNIMLTLANQGSSTLPPGTLVKVSIGNEKNSQILASLYTQEELAVGDTLDFRIVRDVPLIPGVYRIWAKVNERQSVKEILYVNNESEDVMLTVAPLYKPSIKLEKQIYAEGEEIKMEGKILWSDKVVNRQDAEVEIYVINSGIRDKKIVKVNFDGTFSYIYEPENGLNGHFDVGVCCRDEDSRDVMASFDILGLKVNDGNYFICEVETGETKTFNLKVENPCMFAMTDIRVQLLDQLEDCSIEVESVKSLQPGESANIKFTLTGLKVSNGYNYIPANILVTSAEGVSSKLKFRYYCHSSIGHLNADVESVETTLVWGAEREYPIKIVNNGRGKTGEITLSLPSCMEAVNIMPLASLAPGEMAEIKLRLKTTEEMKLNMKAYGKFGINCTNGNGLSIPYSITPVSEALGTLVVDAVDESTYYSDTKPHLGNAEVTVTNTGTGEIVAKGMTGGDGKFVVNNINEGNYQVDVVAEKHYSYSSTVMVDPGRETTHEAFLGYDAVQYTWEVEETGIADSYKITTKVKYETSVPMPVVIVTLPEDKPTIGDVFPVTVENKGFIRADNVNLSLSCKGYKIEFINGTSLDSIEAHKSYTVFARIVENSTSAQSRLNKAYIVPEICLDLKAQAYYDYICGLDKKVRYAKASKSWGICPKSPGGGSNTSGSSGPSGPGIHNFYQAGNTFNITEEQVDEICNCDREPVLSYKLVPVSGVRYQMRGVAADGVSRVKIVLDPSGTFLPPSKCGYQYEWSLSKDIGRLNTYSGVDNIIYTAPEDFPSSYGNEYTINAILHYDDGRGHSDSYTVPIVISRVPLVMLHGLNADQKTWESFEKNMITLSEYKDYQIVRVDYKKTNCDRFKENMYKPGEGIAEVLDSCRKNGIIATKADLVGHSMGGILSRLYVQAGNTYNVHKVITVNTPHSGSPLGDIFGPVLAVMHLEPKLDHFLKAISQFSSAGAVLDLAVNSNAIDKDLNNDYNGHMMKNIPIHAIATEAGIYDVFSDKLEKFAEDCLFKKQAKALLNMCQLSYDLGYRPFDKLEDTDLIVSVRSQLGGLTGGHATLIKGPWHLKSPDDEQVQSTLRSLLRKPVSDSAFSMEGFSPENLYFGNKKNMAKMHKAEETNRESAMNVYFDSDSIYLSVLNSPVDCYGTILALFEDQDIATITLKDGKASCAIPATFSGKIGLCYMERDGNDSIRTIYQELDILQSKRKILEINSSAVSMVVGDRLPFTVDCKWEDGTILSVEPNNVVCNDDIVYYEDGYLLAKAAGKTTLRYSYRGIEAECDVYIEKQEELEILPDGDIDRGGQQSTCATVSLAIDQEAVIERQAFRGTLTVKNGNVDGELKDVKLYLEVRNSEGVLASENEFFIDVESNEGFVGEKDLTSGWTLETGSTGVAKILFIPTVNAAPRGPETYSFGGAFTYIDSTTGTKMTRELYPAYLTVKPTPRMKLDYFMQRDIYGDDALTEDVVEECVPAEFALVINNVGNGDASSVKFETSQPRIVDNAKGLDIEFKFVGYQLNGKAANYVDSETMTTDFGTIPSQSTTYAQWWLQSSLLGHFIEYNVNFTHVTSYDSPDLSLIDTVAIHELIHGFTVDAYCDPIARGFLVNDVMDLNDTPDGVYFSNGNMPVDVSVVDDATLVKAGGDIWTLNVNSSDAGWIYGNVPDPTEGLVLCNIVRHSDGKTIPVDNMWQTPYTLRDGKDPIHEDKLHFIVRCNGSESYDLTFLDRSVGIKDLNSNSSYSQSGIYTMNGVKISNEVTRGVLDALPRGIYIVNGKKIVR